MVAQSRRHPGAASSVRFFTLLVTVLLFLSPSALAAGAVLGLDVGTEYIKAALVKPGIPLEIVLTKDSKRKEASAIAFKASTHGPQAEGQLPERLYGGDALALGARIPGDVYPNLKHLLGASQPGNEESLRTYKTRYPALELYEHSNGTLGFTSRSFGEQGAAYSVEELLGMELKAIRDNAEAMAGSAVKDTVITVPPFYSSNERRSIEFAASLAGLRVLSLISDGMAVGVNYATSRTFGNVDEGGKAEYHLVYDMGAGSTKATVLRMQGKRVKDIGKFNKTVQEVATVGLGWDRTLGGDILNDLIVHDMAEKFVESSAAKKQSIDLNTIKTHGRTMSKFWKESERLRQILSANTASSSFFESLYEDIDFRYKLSRADFETMASDFRSRVSKPIDDALQSAGMTFEDISSVILHGGAVRTPFVQTTLEAAAGGPAKLRTNVNADEAAVFGAAFKAAGLSPSFKVKEILSNDVAIYAATLHWQSFGKERKQQIFLPTSQTGAVKQLPMKKMIEDFSLSFRQKIPVLEIEMPVSEFQTKNLTASAAKLILEHECVAENITTTFSIRIDPANGLPEITKATVSCEGSTAEKKGVMDGVKGMFGFGKSEQKPVSDDDDAELLEPLVDSTSESLSTKTKTSRSSSSSATGKGKDKAKAKETPAAPVRKVHTINIGLETSKLGLLQPVGSELQRIKDGLALFDKSDKGRRLRSELFNGLEGFTYRVRDMLTESGFASVSTADQRGAIEKLLGSTSDWLSEEGSTAGIEAIKEKLQGLKELVSPIQKRKEELTTRPSAVARLQELIKSAGTLQESVSDKLAKAAEAASSSAAAASSTVSSAVSSVTDSLAPETTPDAGESLEEDDEGGASATLSSLAAKFSSYTDVWAYTDSDVTRLTSALGTAKDWLAEKLAAQKALKESDEPVLLSNEIEKAGEKVREIVEELERKGKMQSRASASASASASSSSKKAAAKSKSASKAAASSASAAAASASASGTDSASAGEAETTEAPGDGSSTVESATHTETKTRDEL